MPALIYEKNTGIIKYTVTIEPDIPIAYVDQAPNADCGVLYVSDDHPAIRNESGFCVTSYGVVLPKTTLTWVLTPEQPLTNAPFSLSLSDDLPINSPTLYVYIRATNAIYYDVLELTPSDDVVEFDGFAEPLKFNINTLIHGQVYIPEFEFEVRSA